MYRWCSFCQTYQGEREPFNTIEVTHGICAECKKTRKVAEHIPPVIAFFNELRTELRSGSTPEWNLVLEKADTLKIKPMDLLQGIIQPLLYEIGRLYEEKKISVYQEHLFTTNIQKLIYELERRLGKNISNDAKVDLLLVCIDGNYHDLGIQVINLWCLNQGFNSRTLGPSLPIPSIVKAIETLQPRVLGVSVCEKKNLKDLDLIIGELGKLPSPPSLALGGHALKGATKTFHADYVFNGTSPVSFLDFLTERTRAAFNKAA